jgi:hypothetical protein
MGDHKSAMGHAVESVQASPDALERTLRILRRRSRFRRVTSASLALVVFAGSMLFLLDRFDVAQGSREPLRGDQAISDAPASVKVALPPVSPRVAGTVMVGRPEHVFSVVAGFDALWVSIYDRTGQALIRVNPASKAIEATIPTVSGPGWLTGGGGIVTGYDRVWVVGQGNMPDGGRGAVLQAVDPATNTVAQTIPLTDGIASDVAVGHGSVWVLVGSHGEETTTSSVVRVNPMTGELEARIPIEHEWTRTILATPSSILVAARPMNADGGVGDVYVTGIDPTSNKVVFSRQSTFFPGTVVDDTVWALGPMGHASVAIAQLNPDTGDVVGTPVEVDRKVTGALLESAGQGIWFVGVTSDETGLLQRFDPSSENVDASTDVGPGGVVDMVVSVDSVWPLKTDGTLVRVDLAG